MRTVIIITTLIMENTYRQRRNVSDSTVDISEISLTDQVHVEEYAFQVETCDYKYLVGRHKNILPSLYKVITRADLLYRTAS